MLGRDAIDKFDAIGTFTVWKTYPQH